MVTEPTPHRINQHQRLPRSFLREAPIANELQLSRSGAPRRNHGAHALKPKDGDSGWASRPMRVGHKPGFVWQAQDHGMPISSTPTGSRRRPNETHTAKPSSARSSRARVYDAESGDHAFWDGQILPFERILGAWTLVRHSRGKIFTRYARLSQQWPLHVRVQHAMVRCPSAWCRPAPACRRTMAWVWVWRRSIDARTGRDMGGRWRGTP